MLGPALVIMYLNNIDVSGVSQGSVQGPALVIIYIIGIDANVSSLVLKFTDDTKLHSNVCTCNQMDRLNMITEWNHSPPEAVTAKTVNGFKGVVNPLSQQNRALYISQKRLPTPLL